MTPGGEGVKINLILTDNEHLTVVLQTNSISIQSV